MDINTSWSMKNELESCFHYSKDIWKWIIVHEWKNHYAIKVETETYDNIVESNVPSHFLDDFYSQINHAALDR